MPIMNAMNGLCLKLIYISKIKNLFLANKGKIGVNAEIIVNKMDAKQS